MRRPASLARRAIDRRRTRRQRNDDFLMHIAFIVILLEEEEAAAVMASRGSKAGKKNLPRVRKSIDAMLTELGNYVRRAYRMTLEAFLELHDALAPALLAKFRTGSADTAPTGPNGGFICTKLRLSAAIRFFAGAEVWDLMSSHGIGRSTIYDSIWKVVSCRAGGNRRWIWRQERCRFQQSRRGYRWDVDLDRVPSSQVVPREEQVPDQLPLLAQG